MPHSTVKLRPLRLTYVLPFEAGQAMLVADGVAPLDVAEPVELEEVTTELDCDDDDPVAETVADDTVEEAPSTMSFAPQTYEAVPAGPRVLLR